MTTTNLKHKNKKQYLVKGKSYTKNYLWLQNIKAFDIMFDDDKDIKLIVRRLTTTIKHSSVF